MTVPKSELDSRMLRTKYIFHVLLAAIMISMDCISEAEIPGLVNRRHSGDISVSYNSSTNFACNEGNNLTYLVHELQCVDQQDLLNGTGWVYYSFQVPSDNCTH